jgi:hypothetical protein
MATGADPATTCGERSSAHPREGPMAAVLGDAFAASAESASARPDIRQLASHVWHDQPVQRSNESSRGVLVASIQRRARPRLSSRSVSHALCASLCAHMRRKPHRSVMATSGYPAGWSFLEADSEERAEHDAPGMRASRSGPRLVVAVRASASRGGGKRIMRTSRGRREPGGNC